MRQKHRSFAAHAAVLGLLSSAAGCDFAQPHDGPFLALQVDPAGGPAAPGTPVWVHAATAQDSAVRIATSGATIRWPDGVESATRCLPVHGDRVLVEGFTVRIVDAQALVSAILYDGEGPLARACDEKAGHLQSAMLVLERSGAPPDAGATDAGQAADAQLDDAASSKLPVRP